MRMNKGFSTYYIYRRMQNNGESVEVLLPSLPDRMHWELVTDTWEEGLPTARREKEAFRIHPRSVRILIARNI